MLTSSKLVSFMATGIVGCLWNLDR